MKDIVGGMDFPAEEELVAVSYNSLLACATRCGSLLLYVRVKHRLCVPRV